MNVHSVSDLKSDVRLLDYFLVCPFAPQPRLGLAKCQRSSGFKLFENFESRSREKETSPCIQSSYFGFFESLKMPCLGQLGYLEAASRAHRLLCDTV